MELYDSVFSSFGLNIAQILLTYRDFENPTAKENTKNTIHKLWKADYIPIVNENDTVSIEEIVLGDNDKLSALVAVILNADLLILVSDIDGIFNCNPHLHPDAKLSLMFSTWNPSETASKKRIYVGNRRHDRTKIHAAEICMENNVECGL